MTSGRPDLQRRMAVWYLKTYHPGVTSFKFKFIFFDHCNYSLIVITSDITIIKRNIHQYSIINASAIINGAATNRASGQHITSKIKNNKNATIIQFPK